MPYNRIYEAPPSPRLSHRQLALYAFPGLATALPTLPILVLLPRFYASETDMGLEAVGLALLVARLFDMTTDPLAGWLMDAIPTRWGRRKPWMVLGGVLCAPALLLLSLPSASTTAFELIVLLCLLYAGWTVFTIPYYALGAELSSNAMERTRLASWREGATLTGIVLASSLPLLWSGFGIASSYHFLATSLTTLLIGSVAVFALMWWLEEPLRQNKPYAQANEPLHFGEGLKAVVTGDRMVLVVLLAWFVNSTANGTGTTLFPFFLSDGLMAGETQKNLLIFTYFASAVVGLPIWIWLGRYFDKARLWACSVLIVSFVFAPVPFLGEGHVVFFGIICLLSGLCLGADLALPVSLFADVTDWDRYKTRLNRRSLLFSLWTLSQKLSIAIAAGFTLPLLAWFGFQAGEANSPLALNALGFTYAWLPVALKLMVIALIWNFPLGTRAQRAIRARLSARERATFATN